MWGEGRPLKGESREKTPPQAILRSCFRLTIKNCTKSKWPLFPFPAPVTSMMEVCPIDRSRSAPVTHRDQGVRFQSNSPENAAPGSSSPRKSSVPCRFQLESIFRPNGCEPTLAWFTAWADKLKNSLDTAVPIRPGGFFQTPKIVHRRIQNH